MLYTETQTGNAGLRVTRGGIALRQEHPFSAFTDRNAERNGRQNFACFNVTAGREVEKLNITFFAPVERERLCQNGLQSCVAFTGRQPAWRIIILAWCSFFARAYNGGADFPDPKRANVDEVNVLIAAPCLPHRGVEHLDFGAQTCSRNNSGGALCDNQCEPLWPCSLACCCKSGGSLRTN